MGWNRTKRGNEMLTPVGRLAKTLMQMAVEQTLDTRFTTEELANFISSELGLKQIETNLKRIKDNATSTLGVDYVKLANIADEATRGIETLGF